MRKMFCIIILITLAKGIKISYNVIKQTFVIINYCRHLGSFTCQFKLNCNIREMFFIYLECQAAISEVSIVGKIKNRKNATTSVQDRQEKDLARLQGLRLMDDYFFSEALNGKTAAVQYIVNTILEREDLKIISTKAQVEYKSATMRSIKLDIWAEDENGAIIDIEIQRADSGAGAKRARFHSSMIDRTLLEKGQEFENLADTYVIFITENDKFKQGLPLYHITRTIKELGNTPFGDGAHIIYVNGEFRDTAHPVGRLMHDFACTRADEMFNPLLAAEVRYLKETEGGRFIVANVFDEIRKEGIAEGRIEGKAEGRIETLYGLVKKGLLPLKNAAAEANQTEAVFLAGLNKYLSDAQ